MSRVVWTTVGLGGVMIMAAGAAWADLPELRLGTGLALEPSRLDGPPIAPHRAPTSASASHVGSHGSVLVVDAHGLLVVERSAGALVRADRDGRPRASLKLSPGLGEIVHDGAGAVFVADRGGGRVIRVDPGDASGAGLAELAQIELTEPHGLALTPDGATLLVTDVAEHELVALATRDLSVRWRVELGPEPRGVAVSRDGATAAVGFLSTGAIALVELAGAGERVHWRGLDPRDHVEVREEFGDWGEEQTVARLGEQRSKYRVPVETGRRYARNFYALAFVGHDRLVAPHELATPQLERVPDPGRQDSYGGGAESIPPLVHQLAILARPGAVDSHARFVDLDLHQPKALAYDLTRDTLYVGGFGDDRVAAIADVSQQMPYVDWITFVGDGRSCGVDGLALELDPDGDTDTAAGPSLWIHCEFRRQLVRLTPHDPRSATDDEWLRGEELAASLRAPEVERGAELFRRGRDSRISTADGALACNGCHPEGRADGLAWRLGDSILQTPILAGRVTDTAPYKWDGQDATLPASLRHTMQRLGGSEHSSLSDAEVDAMVAYLHSLPAPRPPRARDPEAVAQGRAVFEAEGCDACHAGPSLADGNAYPLDTTLAAVDTPSLRGLAHSRPYFHDGSAKDLWALLTDRGSIHAMADLSHRDDASLRDLEAYLESL